MPIKPMKSIKQIAAEKNASLADVIDVMNKTLGECLSKLPIDIRNDNSAMFALKREVERSTGDRIKQEYSEVAEPPKKKYFKKAALKAGVECVLGGGTVDDALLAACKVQRITYKECKEESMPSQAFYKKPWQDHSPLAKEITDHFKSEITKFQRGRYLFAITDLYKSASPVNLFKRVAHIMELKRRVVSNSTIRKLSPSEAKFMAIKLYQQDMKLQLISDEVGRSLSTVKAYVAGIDR